MSIYKETIVRKIIFLLSGILILWASHNYAATVQKVWQTQNKLSSFKNFSFYQQNLKLTNNENFGATFNAAQSVVDAATNTKHIRYNQFYQNIPIWNAQIIIHQKNNNLLSNNRLITGKFFSSIKNDIISTTAKISESKITAFATSQYIKRNYGAWQIKNIVVNLIIYPEEKNNQVTAHLAYTVTFLAHNNNKLTKPFLIIDANNYTIYKTWNDLQNDQFTVGQGRGGNAKDPRYGGLGAIYYGNYIKGNNLGKFDVIKHDNYCYVKNNEIELAQSNLQEPVPVYDESSFPIFAYYCDNQAINFDDNGNAPINSGYSPVDDSMFAISQTLKMYRLSQQIPDPLGKHNYILRAYVHVNNFDNAFAFSEQKNTAGNIIYHQQIVIGNGDELFYPMTSIDILAHELSHLFTSNYSNLTYEGQSGGINEAFSDIAGKATVDYVHQQYPWYPNLWTIGEPVSKPYGLLQGKPLRYFDNPTKDGQSIDNAKNYTPPLDVHYASGVYNKAFYLLSTTKNWTIQKAFNLFAKANMNYWTPSSDFDFAACGVLQQAKEQKENLTDIITAFNKVGVTCSRKIVDENYAAINTAAKNN